MKSFFNWFKTFPEFSDFQSSLSVLCASDKKMAEATATAFNNLPGYNAMQKPPLHGTIQQITDSGNKLASVMNKYHSETEPYIQKYNPLIDIYTEFSSWRTVRERAQAVCDKSQSEVTKAKAYLEKIRPYNNEINIHQAEAALETAERTAAMDRDSFNDTNKRIHEAEIPYQNKFVGQFSQITSDLLKVRIEAAKNVKEVCGDFEKAIETFAEYDDGKVDFYKQYLTELESIEVHEFGEILPITDESSA